jgi:hypothetical protein
MLDVRNYGMAKLIEIAFFLKRCDSIEIVALAVAHTFPASDVDIIMQGIKFIA